MGKEKGKMKVSHKKIIYFVRHAEALHNVKEKEAVQAVIAKGEKCKKKQDEARRSVLLSDPSLKDAPLSDGGVDQVKRSSEIMKELFSAGSKDEGFAGFVDVKDSQKKMSPFRKPDVVLVSPLRRALMTATQIFLEGETEPPLFLAIEALREKRTGMACDERSSVDVLKQEFPHVDFSDVEHTEKYLSPVKVGENNDDVRARGAKYIDERLCDPALGTHVAVVSHKGWLREMRKTLKSRVDQGNLKADFDLEQWDTTLYGNAEVRVAAFRWDAEGSLYSVYSRSLENAKNACMMGDGFEFSLGPPSSGFSIFLADRTTKVHFISVPEGEHNVALRDSGKEETLMQTSNMLLEHHQLYDARLTSRGARQAAKLRDHLANRPSGGRPFTAFESVVVSPLTRACQTAKIIFHQSPGTYGGHVIPPPTILVREECRERFGKYICDSRHSVTHLKMHYPNFDFSEMESDQDFLHQPDRETSVACGDRAVRFLEWLSARPEKCIAVVTHAEFLRHLFGQFGDTLDEEDRSVLQRTTANCELRSVVLCSHGKVERKARDQQSAPSTFRVRTGSNSSLTAFMNEIE